MSPAGGGRAGAPAVFRLQFGTDGSQRATSPNGARPGEPGEAVRLRQVMAQTVVDGGWAPSEPVRDALRTVPRRRFAPEVNLAAAYDGGDRAVITRRDETGTAISRHPNQRQRRPVAALRCALPEAGVAGPYGHGLPPRV
ncbi:hypothetical protein ABTY20_03740 [Streptomyces sp. NPDC126497]|uniref:hypothetical protein n=1 Tax=Streptomyces sp. NPDC126497 TaxID=3155313 RepID=UPI0033249246